MYTVPAVRPAYYDRDIAAQQLAYDATGIGNHAETVQSGYVVPSGKRAVVNYAKTRLMITTAFAATGDNRVFILALIGLLEVCICDANTRTIAAGTTDKEAVGGEYHLVAGDALEIVTVNSMTGAGQTTYHAGILANEYTA